MNEDLDKRAEDLFNELTGKNSKKNKSEYGTNRHMDSKPMDDLFADTRKDPDTLQELFQQYEDEFDSMIAEDFAEMDLYEFEYIYMPSLAQTDWIDTFSRDVCLGDIDQLMVNAAERDIIMDPTEFNVKRKHREGLDIYFYEFPDPSSSPMALYGVIIFGEKGGRYYTLEYEDPGCYMVCNPTTDSHYNYGTLKNITKEAFLKKAISLYKTTDFQALE